MSLRGIAKVKQIADVYIANKALTDVLKRLSLSFPFFSKLLSELIIRFIKNNAYMKGGRLWDKMKDTISSTENRPKKFGIKNEIGKRYERFLSFTMILGKYVYN